MINRSLILALTAGAFLAVPTAPAWAQSRPSWCGSQGSLNPAEQTVCARRTLWGLDGSLNVAYQAALGRAGRHRSELVSDQASWIRGPRNGCGGSVSCLSGVYRDRIVTLGDLYN